MIIFILLLIPLLITSLRIYPNLPSKKWMEINSKTKSVGESQERHNWAEELIKNIISCLPEVFVSYLKIFILCYL